MKNLNRPSHVKKTGNAQRVTGFFYLFPIRHFSA